MGLPHCFSNEIMLWWLVAWKLSAYLHGFFETVNFPVDILLCDVSRSFMEINSLFKGKLVCLEGQRKTCELLLERQTRLITSAARSHTWFKPEAQNIPTCGEDNLTSQTLLLIYLWEALMTNSSHRISLCFPCNNGVKVSKINVRNSWVNV